MDGAPTMSDQNWISGIFKQDVDISLVDLSHYRIHIGNICG